MANALTHEKSPYLRQHADNPVDWLPWGDRAFEKARKEDKPIFLSVGYSTCHWCHVMAHESFEDERIAAILNRDFVPVKVDREERPDVDRIYMLFVQATTGSGGWPMSVFLTPDLKPFFGGTYFPPGTRYGRPGFSDLLIHLAQVWSNRRDEIDRSSDSVIEQLRSINSAADGTSRIDREFFASAFWQFRRTFDTRWGGFGGAPKFPRPSVLNYLLCYYASENNSDALDMVTKTLRAMAAGGIHDHLGGGFHRYSVDERWFVPHFEKMLYDQAQLAIAYLDAYQITRDAGFSSAARGIFSYALRDLADPAGGFYSAEDADSPDPENPSHPGEGAFYIWRQAEIESFLGADSQLFCNIFGVKPEGNVEHDPQCEFIGRNILYRAQLDLPPPQSCQILFRARAKRPRPHLDNKLLTSWNALMISAFVKGYRTLGDQNLLIAAKRAAAFILFKMFDPAGAQLLRRFCDGEAAIPAFLDDYAFLAQALLDLFEATGDPSYLTAALDLSTRGFARFEDHEQYGFFNTEEQASDLLLRMKDDYDGAEPSGNSVAADVLLRLAALTGTGDFRERAERAINAFTTKIQAQPTMAPQMLVAVDRLLAEPGHVIIRCAEVGSDVEALITQHSTQFTPGLVVLALTDSAARALAGTSPFLAGLERRGRITVYKCRNFACELPQVIE